MRKPSDKNYILILAKSNNNQFLADYLRREYGRRYAVDLFETIPGKKPGFDPSKTKLLIIPGYGGGDWNPSPEVIDGFMDYVEAGGNMLVICDSVHEFVKKGWAIVLDKETGEPACYPVEGFDKGNGRLPEHIEYVRVRTKEADAMNSTRTLVGTADAQRRLTSVYRRRGDIFFLRGDFDKERILPFGEIDKNGLNQFEGIGTAKTLFNFLYIRQGKGNIVLSNDHNEEDIGSYLNRCLLYNIKGAVLAKLGFQTDGLFSEYKQDVEFLLGLKSGYRRDVRPHRRFNDEFRRFVYEDILGLWSPARPVRKSLDPALGAIKERIGNMRG